jgi:hypothetical protein
LHATPLRLTLLTDVDRIDDLVRRLHAALVGFAPEPVAEEEQRRTG